MSPNDFRDSLLRSLTITPGLSPALSIGSTAASMAAVQYSYRLDYDYLSPETKRVIDQVTRMGETALEAITRRWMSDRGLLSLGGTAEGEFERQHIIQSEIVRAREALTKHAGPLISRYMRLEDQIGEIIAENEQIIENIDKFLTVVNVRAGRRRGEEWDDRVAEMTAWIAETTQEAAGLVLKAYDGARFAFISRREAAEFKLQFHE